MYTIRKAKKEEVIELAHLFDRYRIFYEQPSDVEGAIHFLEERLKNGDAIIFIAEILGKLIGFVQLYPLFSSTRMQKLWLLNDLFVAEAHRGKGISIQLIEQAKLLTIESSACGLMLETAKTNVIGNNLYPRTGFALDSDHNYYFWENTSK